MSTKIYEGYRIKNITEKEFIEKYKYLKDLIEEKAKLKIRETITSLFYSLLDNNCSNKESNILELVKEEIDHEIEEIKKGYRSPEYDKSIGFSLKEYKGDLYLYLFSEDLDLNKLLINEIKNIEDYCYWNNTDKPDEVSESHWKKRENIWNTLLTGYSFEKSGFSEFNFFNSLDFLENIDFKYEILINVDLEKRTKEYVQNQTISLLDSERNGKTYEEYKYSVFLKSKKEVEEGKHKNIEKQFEEYFKENYKTVTKENFNTITSMKSLKDKV